ncbi:hypothetical protein [Duganella sp. HH105]|uniref:hypothetical protein n=1 Tax=Duganella sp. HH105 TaxID=1781067 RepID=UPI000877DB8E|nr:hypothetical protein [Duganella sp. HH105]OEZ59884.1 hypothetical protein DUGA6_35230 [Duganella sp. HH105]
MKRRALGSLGLASAMGLLAGCGSLAPPKYENGQYVPPPAKHALQIQLNTLSCGTGEPAKAMLTPLVSVLGSAIINQTYDRFVNWLDEKKANMSASSTGVATTNFLVGKNPKRCLVLTRDGSMEAMFSIEPTESGGYWHMTPYSLKFSSSEAKEAPDGEKSIVADIQFATPGADGALSTFFQGTFDLGVRKAGAQTLDAKAFVGQDSGPYGLPKVPDSDAMVTMKITASLVEHGEGRDWIRGVTDSLREKENRDKILKPFLDALAKKAP